MVGITLSAERIRSAPPEIRHWLEQEVLQGLGLHPEAAEAPPHLVGCTPEEAAEVLGAVRKLPGAAEILFDIAREPGIGGKDGVRVLRLGDVLRRARLSEPGQVIDCVEAINQAFSQLRGEKGAMLVGLDQRGLLVVSEATQQSLLALWRELIGAPAAAAAPAAKPEAPAEYSMHADLKPRAAPAG